MFFHLIFCAISKVKLDDGPLIFIIKLQKEVIVYNSEKMLF